MPNLNEHIFTPAEVVAWDYDFYVNGNPAADLMSYWTSEMSITLINAVFLKLPITVDSVRKRLRIYSPYSRGVILDPPQPWLHPDEATGELYLYQAVGGITE